MALSEKAVQELASLLKIKHEALISAIKSEDNIEFESLGVPVKYSYTEDERGELLRNADKESYNKGKTAGIEMNFKEIKKEKFPESEAGDFIELFKEIELNEKNIRNKLLEDQKLDLTGNVDERIAEERRLKEEAVQKSQALQGIIKSKEEAFENERNTWKHNSRNQKVDTDIMNAFSSLEFDIPEHIEMKGDEEVQKFISTERMKAKILFDATYKREYDDNDNVIYVKNGEKVIDETTLSPRSINDIAVPFAKEINLSLRKEETFGRGAGDSKIHTSGIRKGMTDEQALEYTKSKNIKEGTAQFDDIWKTHRELNPKQ